ncbi:MAG: MFS transporter [Planctomycetaceae bacterium]
MTASVSSSSRGAWMALIAALLGWLFDGAEMGLFSLVGNAAVKNLLEGTGREGQAGAWFGTIIATFLVGAATGGVVFGWLGDRIGRVRAMSLSVLVYALFTGFCGFAQNVEQLAGLRFIASLGMGGEWSLGVALVMEVWPNRSRAFMAGLIGAAANVGYLLIAVVGMGLDALLETSIPEILSSIGLSAEDVGRLTAHKGWRLMMMIGTTPALLTFLFRIFVPESEKWEEEHRKGVTSNWMTADLWGVLFGLAGPAAIIAVWAYDWPWLPLWGRIAVTLAGLGIAIAGYTYPVIQFMKRCAASGQAGAGDLKTTVNRMLLGACLSGVALLGTWASMQWAAKWAGEMTKNEFLSREWTQFWLSVGAIVGTILAALAGDWLGRRVTFFLLCLLSLASAEILYAFNSSYNAMFLFCCFLAGGCTASFYGWLPLYLPELFPTRLRATGQGFSFNFGRILAAVGSLQAGVLQDQVFGGQFPKAGMVMSLIYLVGLVVIWFAPETKGQPLPD